MANQYLNAVLIKQFRQQYTHYSLAGENRYKTVCLKCFAGGEKTMPLLAKVLEKKMNHPQIVAGIIRQLEKECCPQNSQLIHFLQKLTRLLTVYARSTYASPHYQRWMEKLGSLEQLFRSFQDNVQQILLHKLNAILFGGADAANEGLAYSEDIEQVQITIEQYLDELWNYYDECIFFLQQEAAESRPAHIASFVEEKLYRLAVWIEQVILCTEATQCQLAQWKLLLFNSENQQLYN